MTGYHIERENTRITRKKKMRCKSDAQESASRSSIPHDQKRNQQRRGDNITEGKGRKKRRVKAVLISSRENFDYTITTTTDDPAAVSAPGGGTYTFTAHQPVACDLLGTVPFFKVPESQAGIVARGDEFPAVGRERERCNCCWMRQHCVCTLT